MKELIEALSIFAKYADKYAPTHCEHDVLIVVGVAKDQVTKEEAARLDALGFFWSDEYDAWSSFRFGSA